MFYGERYSHSSVYGNTDFVKLAEAMGVVGYRIENKQDLRNILKRGASSWSTGVSRCLFADGGKCIADGTGRWKIEPNDIGGWKWNTP